MSDASPLIGFAGIGVLGSAIVQNLVKAGHSVLAHDPNPAAREKAAEVGAALAGDLADLAATCPVIFTCLPSAAALKAVSEGIAATPFAGTPLPGAETQIVVELSTMSIADKEAARDVLEASGRSAVDCPVSGNRIVALKGGLTAFLSGPATACDAIRAILGDVCREVHFVGPFGHGIKTKLAGNILNLVHNTVAAEAMVLAMKSGLDPAAFHRVISGSNSSSSMFEVRGALMVANDYAREGMNFSVPLKDSRIIAEHAASLGVPIALYQTAVQYYHAANAQGLAHLDASAVCRVLERLANCERPAPETTAPEGTGN